MEYLFVIVGLFFVAHIYLKVAEKYNIIDKPNHRSSHKTPIIRGGGVLFILAILVFFFIEDFQYVYFTIGVFVVAIISFIDDIYTIKASARLPFQFLAIFLCLVELNIPIQDFYLIIPLLIAGVGFLNVYNFMDGVNGITGLYSIVVLFFLLLLNNTQTEIVNNKLIYYSLISLIVFGYYNYRQKARMFAGDIGSISIAVLIFFIIISLIKELKSPLILLLIVVYGIDTILTIVYRKSKLKEKITEPHRHHIYQKLVDICKLSHLKVAITYSLLQAFIGVLVFFTHNLSLINQLYIFILVNVVFILLYILTFKKIEKIKKTF